MEKYIFPGIGELDTEKLDLFYCGTIELSGQEIKVDLNFEGFQINLHCLDTARNIVINIADFDMRNQQFIEADYRNEQGEAVKEYLQHHLQEIDPEELTDIVNPDQDEASKELQLMRALKLVRIGLYPGNEDQFAVFDYTIGNELTQYLIVINIKIDGHLDSIIMES